MFEHLANPILALINWNRVVKDGGYVFMIVPQRDAAPGDVGRELSTYAEWYQAMTEKWTPETIGEERTLAAGGVRMHYFVYTAETLKSFINNLCMWDYQPLDWELVAEEDPDQKVGNGFTLVYKVHKIAPSNSNGSLLDSLSEKDRAIVTDDRLWREVGAPVILNEDGSIQSTPLNLGRTMPNGDPIALTADGLAAIHTEGDDTAVAEPQPKTKKRKTKAAK